MTISGMAFAIFRIPARLVSPFCKMGTNEGPNESACEALLHVRANNAKQ
jgi:hypothetical protein